MKNKKSKFNKKFSKDLETIGKNIKEYRLSKKITQKELGKQLGVSGNTISYIELGKSACPLPILLELCSILKINLFDILKNTSILYLDAPKNILKQFNQLNLEYQDLVKDFLTLLIKRQRTSDPTLTSLENNLSNRNKNDNNFDFEDENYNSEEFTNFVNQHVPKNIRYNNDNYHW